MARGFEYLLWGDGVDALYEGLEREGTVVVEHAFAHADGYAFGIVIREGYLTCELAFGCGEGAWTKGAVDETV